MHKKKMPQEGITPCGTYLSKYNYSCFTDVLKWQLRG